MMTFFIYSLPRASNFEPFPRRVLQEEPSPWPNTPCRCHIHALLRLAMVQKLETSKCTTMGIPQMNQQMAHKFSQNFTMFWYANCHGKYIIFGCTTSFPWILSIPSHGSNIPLGSRLDVAQVCLVLPDPAESIRSTKSADNNSVTTVQHLSRVGCLFS